MHAGKSIVLVPLFALALAGSAFAQIGTATAVVPPQRGYVAALVGAVSGPPAGPVFAVEYGDNIDRNAQAYVAISYFENLMRQTVRDELTTLGTRLSTLTATPWTLAGHDRGVTLAVGGKYLVGGGTVRPYVGGGAGIINLKRTVTEAHIGDVTAAVFNDFDIGAADLSLATASLTRPMGEAVVGVGIVAGSTYIDVGYRYRKAFRLANGLDFSQLSVGLGYKF
jgi:hypothetical protein